MNTAAPEADGATPAETSSHSIAKSSDPSLSTTRDTDAPASADQEDSSTIASAISSVKETVSTQASHAAESISGSAESAKRMVGDAAATAGLGFAERDQQSYRSRSPQQYGRGSTSRSNDPSNALYIGNLYFDVTEDDLRREMERFGTVQSIKIIYDGRGLSKG